MRNKPSRKNWRKTPKKEGSNQFVMMYLATIVLLALAGMASAERTLVSEQCRSAVRATCGPDSKYACSNYTCLRACIKDNMDILKAAGCSRDNRPDRRSNKRVTRFPASWGPPPAAQTKDLRPLPGGYGQGSGTLATWIREKMAQDKTIRSQRGSYYY